MEMEVKQLNKILAAIEDNLPKEHRHLVELLRGAIPKVSVKQDYDVDVFRSYLDPQNFLTVPQPKTPEITIENNGIRYTLLSPVLISYIYTSY